MKKIFVLFLLGFTFGCSNKTGISPFVDTPPAGYPTQRSAEGPLVWEKSPGILKQYSRFYVPPVVVSIGDSGRALPANPSEMDDLGDQLRTKIIRGFGSKHVLANQPIKGSAVVKVKLLNVWSERGLINVIPGSRAVNPLAGGATFEAVVIDSISNEEVAKIWDSRAGTPKNYMTGWDKWAGTEAVFDDWSRILSNKLMNDGMGMPYQTATRW